MTIKLSPRQQRVLELMLSGWTMLSTFGLRGEIWVQKGGVGRGGETKTVYSATLEALFVRGLICVKKAKIDAAPMKYFTYELTPLGRKTAKGLPDTEVKMRCLDCSHHQSGGHRPCDECGGHTIRKITGPFEF